MLDTTSSVYAPIHQGPAYRSPVSEFRPSPEIIGLPAIIRVGTIRRLAEQVARRRRNVTADEIMNTRGGTRRITTARQEVMWLARNMKLANGRHRFSLTTIGHHFVAHEGGLDHTTILLGVRRHAKVLRAAVIAKVEADNAASALLHGVTR